ncbi:YdiK family protein [Neobacillus fumarioli]|uniref:YdiK family protein n=1 Tax=Neobacillus fumarioli TaxID=105229 RepID=UPI00082989B6|nr:YdiK family protein [Neobacillus fumarioli]
MRRSPLLSGFIYLLLGGLFTYFAVNTVQTNGWGFFSFLLIILATVDIGSGIKMFAFYMKYRDKMKR